MSQLRRWLLAESQCPLNLIWHELTLWLTNVPVKSFFQKFWHWRHWDSANAWFKLTVMWGLYTGWLNVLNGTLGDSPYFGHIVPLGCVCVYVIKILTCPLRCFFSSADRCKEVQQIREQHPNKIPVRPSSSFSLIFNPCCLFECLHITSFSVASTTRGVHSQVSC